MRSSSARQGVRSQLLRSRNSTGVVAQALAQHVDRHLQGKRALGMTRRPEGAGRTGVHQHVIIRSRHIGAVVHAEKRPGRTRAEARTGRAVVDQFDCGQGAVPHAGHPDLHPVLGTVAADEVFVLAGQDDLDRPPSLLSQLGGHDRVRQSRGFGAEMPADEVVANPYLGVRQPKIIGQLGPGAGDRLGPAVDDETVGSLPVGHRSVGLQTAVGLDRGTKLLLNNGIRDLDRVGHVAAIFAEQRTCGRSDDVTLLGRSLGCPDQADRPHPGPGFDLFARSRPARHHQRGVGPHGLVQADHKRARLEPNPHRPRRVMGLVLAVCGQGGDFVSLIAHPAALQHVDRPHPGHFFRSRRVHRLDLGRSVRRADNHPVQHAGQMEIAGVARPAGNFLPGVNPGDGLAHDSQPGVGVPGRGFILGDGAGHRGEMTLVADF